MMIMFFLQEVVIKRNLIYQFLTHRQQDRLIMLIPLVMQTMQPLQDQLLGVMLQENHLIGLDSQDNQHGYGVAMMVQIIMFGIHLILVLITLIPLVVQKELDILLVLIQEVQLQHQEIILQHLRVFLLILKNLL